MKKKAATPKGTSRKLKVRKETVKDLAARKVNNVKGGGKFTLPLCFGQQAPKPFTPPVDPISMQPQNCIAQG